MTDFWARLLVVYLAGAWFMTLFLVWYEQHDEIEYRVPVIVLLSIVWPLFWVVIAGITVYEHVSVLLRKKS